MSPQGQTTEFNGLAEILFQAAEIQGEYVRSSGNSFTDVCMDGYFDLVDMAQFVIDALKAAGYEITKPWTLTNSEGTNLEGAGNLYAIELPVPIGDDGQNRAWKNVSYWHGGREKPITLHQVPREMTVDAAKSMAADLLAAVAFGDTLNPEDGAR